MEWSSSTMNDLQDCFVKKNYRQWAKAVRSGEIENFDDPLHELVEDLSHILITELELKPDTHDKVMKFMDLAALAGKKL